MLRLYDAAGNLLATNDNGASDGRNAKLSYKVPKNGGGTFYIEVLASDATAEPTKGEYILSVKGANARCQPFQVTSTDPARWRLALRAVRRRYTVDVNDVILLTDAPGLRPEGRRVAATGSLPATATPPTSTPASQWTSASAATGTITC